jgi:hypothetical protein
VAEAYLDGNRDERVDPDAEDVLEGVLGGLLVAKTFSALPLERLGGPVDDAAVDFFLRRARYARSLVDLRGSLPSAG